MLGGVLFTSKGGARLEVRNSGELVLWCCTKAEMQRFEVEVQDFIKASRSMSIVTARAGMV